MVSVNNMTHHRNLGKPLNGPGEIDTGIHKSKYHWEDFSEVLKSRSRRGYFNIIQHGSL